MGLVIWLIGVAALLRLHSLCRFSADFTRLSDADRYFVPDIIAETLKFK